MAKEMCPFWVGYLLSSPIRKLWHNPEKILKPYVAQGMKVLDIGCAMGFFSFPLARIVGPQGKVICIDVQDRMIRSLKKRARRAGLNERIEARVCPENSFCLDDLREKIDFALAFAVVHEVPDPLVLFSEIYEALKSAGTVLMAEPKGHVSEKDFEASTYDTEGHGFKVTDRPYIRSARAAILQKQEQ